MSPLALALAASLAAAPAEDSDALRPSEADVETLALLQADNVEVIRLATVAQVTSESALIDLFSAELSREHGRMSRLTVQLARELNVDLTLHPSESPDEEARRRAMRERVAVLERLRGDDFDRAYARVMRDLHRQGLDRASRALGQTRHPRVRELLEKLVPELESQLRAAEAVMKATAAPTA